MTDLRVLYEAYAKIQKARIGNENRLNQLLRNGKRDGIGVEVLQEIIKDLKTKEKEILQVAEEVLMEYKIYNEFLSQVKGFSSALGLRLLAIDWDLSKNLSSWNAYAGLVPKVWKCKCAKGHKILLPADPRKKVQRCYAVVGMKKGKNGLETVKCDEIVVEGEEADCKKYLGYIAFWNADAKSTLGIIARTLVKAGGWYKEKYFEWKIKYLKQGLKPSHAVNRALRKIAKIFLAHFYQAWHELEGLEYRLPYVFEYLKHDEFVSWKDVVEYDEKVEVRKRPKKIKLKMGKRKLYKGESH